MPELQRNRDRELSVIQDCAATSCTYNADHLCEAGEIEVEPTERGPICATYEPERNATTRR